MLKLVLGLRGRVCEKHQGKSPYLGKRQGLCVGVGERFYHCLHVHVRHLPSSHTRAYMFICYGPTSGYARSHIHFYGPTSGYARSHIHFYGPTSGWESGLKPKLGLGLELGLELGLGLGLNSRSMLGLHQC